MSDAAKITVVLEPGVSMGEAERIAVAICTMRGVSTAVPVELTGHDGIAMMKARSDLREKVYAALDPIFFPGRQR